MMKKMFKLDRSLFKVTTSIGTIGFFSLAFPILFESIMTYLLGTVHTVLLSSYSENSVAAVGAANTLINMFSLLCSVIATGATVVISNHIGGERLKSAEETSFTGIAVSVSVSVILIPVILLLGSGMISLLNLKNTIAAEASVYLKIRMSFLLFQAVTGMLLAIFRSYGYPKYTLIVNTFVNICNIALATIIVYFPEYSPLTGVSGLAAACVICQFFGLILTVYIAYRIKIKLSIPKSIGAFFMHLKKLLCIGVPAGMSSASLTVSQLVNTSFVAMIGDYALSAQIYFSTIASYVYLFSNSAGTANSIMIGRLCGAKKFERADMTNRQLIRMTTVINFIVSVIILIARYPILSIFTNNRLIFAMAAYILAIDIIAEQARAVSQVYEYALRAAGDVIFSLIFTTASCWIFSISLSYILAIKCNMGLVGCWIGIAADESVRAISTYLRWQYLFGRKRIKYSSN